MKFPPFYAALLSAGVFAGQWVSGQPAPLAPPTGLTITNAPAVSGSAPAPTGPHMTLLETDYRFGKVNMGQQVNHTFVVSNSGDQTLVITSVAPGCHCTTARDWTHRIEPGKTGDIPIKFDSSGIHGDLTRTITVTSNSKIGAVQTLFLHGSVWREIEVTPQNAYMTVMPDAEAPAISVVHIVNQAETPLKLFKPTSVNGLFKAELKTTKEGKEFELTVTARPPFTPGNNVGTISIPTSSSNVPLLMVTALVMVQPSIGVAPMQIVLPPVVMDWSTNIITITANGKKPLSLTNLQVCCDKGIKAEIQEIIPGRVFHVMAAFPPGFNLVPGQRYQLSVKSNNPERQTIVIPISQFPRRPGMAPGPLARPKVMSQAPPLPNAAAHP